MKFPRWLNGLLIFLLVVGVIFRFVNLNHKVYWHDEVYTTMRAAGYTRGEIDQELFQNRLIPVTELQKFQRIKPASTAADTIRSLMVEDPQHPPLYFLITRYWMQAFDGVLSWMFKSSLTTSRSLPALLGVLALPAMYALAWELFASPAVALMATTLLALSPFDVLFAQTARQYSLLTLMVIASSALLLRALRLAKNAKPLLHSSSAGRSPWPINWLINWLRSRWLSWGLYGLAVAIGLYTHPFFALTIAGHIVYIHADAIVTPLPGIRQRLRAFWLSLVAAIILYSPWLVVMQTNQQRAFATTNWSEMSPGIDYLLKLWTLSFTSLFFDLDFGSDNPWTFVFRLPFLLLIGGSLYFVVRRTSPSTWLFVVTSVLVPFLLLALPDLLLGGKRSAVSRYLIACYPSVQLAVAYFLTSKLSVKTVYSGRSPRLTKTTSAYTLHPKLQSSLKPWLWRGMAGLLLIASLVSLTTSASAASWWNKDVSYFNNQTADIINKLPSPLIISDIGDDYTNTGEMISLSYRLNHTVQLLLLNNDTPEFIRTSEFATILRGRSAIAFRPSSSIKQALDAQYRKLTRLHKEERLWQIPSESFPGNIAVVTWKCGRGESESLPRLGI